MCPQCVKVFGEGQCLRSVSSMAMSIELGRKGKKIYIFYHVSYTLQVSQFEDFLSFNPGTYIPAKYAGYYLHFKPPISNGADHLKHSLNIFKASNLFPFHQHFCSLEKVIQIKFFFLFSINHSTLRFFSKSFSMSKGINIEDK